MASDVRAGVAAAGAFLAVFAVAWAASDVPLYLDDFTYMLLAELHRDEWLCWLDPRGWFSHFRPWFYFCWWALGPLALDGGVVRAFECLVWAFTTVWVGAWGWRRHGAVGVAAAALALPANAAFVELLGWKSWLTSAGTLAGLAVGLVELTRPAPRAWIVLAAGIFALGFKETGAFALGCAAVFGAVDRAAITTRRPSAPWPVVGAGVALIVGAIAAASFAAQKTQPTSFFGNLPANASGLVPLLWLLPAALAAAGPIAAAVGAIAAVALVWAPSWLAWPVVLGSAAVLLRDRPGWWLAAVASFAVANIGIATSRPYLLDGWLVIAVGWLAGAAPVRSRWVWAAGGVISAVLLARWGVTLRDQGAAAREQRQFLASFDPAPAKGLYVPPDGYRIDLDVLVWLDRGAASLMDAPSNSRPVQVGPRSGIWADVTPIDPSQPMVAPPMRLGLYKLAPGAKPPGAPGRARPRRPR